MAFAARQQNGGGVNGSCFSATHQINCKLFEQKLQQPPQSHRPLYLRPQRRRPRRAAVATCAACSRHPPFPALSTCCRATWRGSAKFMATFMCRVACAVNTGNAGKKCIINDVINPHAGTPTQWCHPLPSPLPFLCSPAPLLPSTVQLQAQ